MLLQRCLVALGAVSLISCGSSVSGSPPRDIGQPVPPAEAPPATCGPGGLMESIGKNHLLVGYADDNDLAQFDLRYHYLTGPDLDDQPPPCTNYNWWGCWQNGSFVQNFIAAAKENQQIPMFTYYMIVNAVGDGTGEITTAIRDQGFMARYLADFRRFLTRVGSEVAFIHIEPDFWGYGGKLAIPEGKDARSLPAAVAAASSSCDQFEDNLAGLGKCMIAMVRVHAPNAKVGLHASGWGTNFDVLLNRETWLDPSAEGAKLGNFLKSCGADLGDFVVADMSDRDAGCYQHGGPNCTPSRNTWWNEGTTLPSFAQVFTWATSVADTVGLPILWWQIPVGNQKQNDTNDHWKDNRVDYLFGHLDQVTATRAIGLAFGSGAGSQTTPSTDGGNLASWAETYRSAGGAPICP
jgi:hypothetical protein